jgi:hypothetical protein
MGCQLAPSECTRVFFLAPLDGKEHSEKSTSFRETTTVFSVQKTTRDHSDIIEDIYTCNTPSKTPELVHYFITSITSILGLPLCK